MDVMRIRIDSRKRQALKIVINRFIEKQSYSFLY